MITVADLQEGEDVLDVGCGSGATSIAAPHRTTGLVIEIDLSADLLSLGDQRASRAGTRNVSIQEGDASTYIPPTSRVDVVVTLLVPFLDRVGVEPITVEPAPHPSVWVGADVDDAVSFFRSDIADQFEPYTTREAMAGVYTDLPTALSPYCSKDGAKLPAAAWIVRSDRWAS